MYTFVTDGIESALQQAKDAAGDRDVTVMGGAETGRQYIAAGLVDEIQIHLVPVLFGSGTRMFDGLDIGHVQLEPIEVINTPRATHVRYRIIKQHPGKGDPATHKGRPIMEGRSVRRSGRCWFATGRGS